jgi:hypothetical protein
MFTCKHCNVKYRVGHICPTPPARRKGAGKVMIGGILTATVILSPIGVPLVLKGLSDLKAHKEVT